MCTFANNFQAIYRVPSPYISSLPIKSSKHIGSFGSKIPNIIYTDEQRAAIITYRLNQKLSLDKIRLLYSIDHPDWPIPCTRTIWKILNDVKTCANASKSPTSKPKVQYPSRQIPEEIKIYVVAITENKAVENENFCLRKIANKAGISKTSVRNILKKEGYKAYKKQAHQQLIRDDAVRRMDHCTSMFEEIAMDPQLPENICFSDECKIEISGEPNRQQLRFWRTNAPEEVIQVHTQFKQKLNVWAGIYKSKIIGPFFFDNNINADAYLEMLRINAIPAIRELEQQKNVSKTLHF